MKLKYDIVKGNKILMGDVNYIEKLKDCLIVVSKNKQAVFLYINDYTKDITVNQTVIYDDMNIEYDNY